MNSPVHLRGAVRPVAVLATAGWVAVAGCWLVALFLPWTARGLLSSASLLDAVRLVRDGVVGDVVAPAAALALLLPAAAGVVLLALSGFRGRWVWGVQLLVACAGAVGSAGFAWRLAGGELERAGPGAWLSLLGVLLALLAAVAGWFDVRLRAALERG